MATEYGIGHSTGRDLMRLSETEAEREAVGRMVEFGGSECDVRLVAAIARRGGQADVAALVVQMLAVDTASPDRVQTRQADEAGDQRSS